MNSDEKVIADSGEEIVADSDGKLLLIVKKFEPILIR
jgi:hypothetical protein